jgi:hypothetical protein
LSCRYNKIFVVCPGGISTGGPEGLHQLVHELRALGAHAHISFYPFGKDFEVANAYRDYAVSPERPEDQTGNLIIVPEIFAGLSTHYRFATTAIWWLSVDNFFAVRREDYERLDTRARLLVYRLGLRDSPPHQPRFSRLRGGLHFAQSAYAMNFLQGRGIKAYPLGDYLHSQFVCEADRGPRDRIVLYNKAKPSVALTELLSGCTDIAWVPISGMSREDVRAACRRAMLYVDFGPHPGRDRLPREAAISGACVITGQRGSAANDIDVAIPRTFKLDEQQPGFKARFRHLVDAVMNDFASAQSQFADYRTMIAQDRERFRRHVRDGFFAAGALAGTK